MQLKSDFQFSTSFKNALLLYNFIYIKLLKNVKVSMLYNTHKSIIKTLSNAQTISFIIIPKHENDGYIMFIHRKYFMLLFF